MKHECKCQIIVDLSPIWSLIWNESTIFFFKLVRVYEILKHMEIFLLEHLNLGSRFRMDYIFKSYNSKKVSKTINEKRSCFKKSWMRTFDDSPHAREQEGRINNEHFFQCRSKIFSHYLHYFSYHLSKDK